MSYRGETPGKKIARLRYWEGVKREMGPRFYKAHHLVLLSAQAGDVSVLLGLGVDPQFIIGVDTDKHAIAAAKHKFFRAACLHGDVVQIIKELAEDGTKLGSVYLDFCNQMCDHTWSSIEGVLPYMPRGSVFGCAFLMGREQQRWKRKIDLLKKSPKYDSFKSRTELIDHDMRALAKKHKRIFSAQEFTYYASNGTDRYGKPMIICRGKMSASSKKPRLLRIETNSFDLGCAATRLERAGRSPALLLNASPFSVSAWRAHATRGSYDV